MAPIQQHQILKLLADGARQPHPSQQQQHPPPQVPPPPYEAVDNGDDAEDEDEAEANDQEHAPSPPLKLTIDATHTIRGHNNLISTSPTALTDATKLSTVLLHAINKLNAAANEDPTRPARPLKVDLTINCGIAVIGDRNVVGNTGLRPKSPMTLGTPIVGADNVAAGAKRKAAVDEVSSQGLFAMPDASADSFFQDHGDDHPELKRIAIKREE